METLKKKTEKKELSQKEREALIDEAKMLKIRIKMDESRVKEIIALLDIRKACTVVTLKGSSLVVTEKENFDPPTPIEILEELKSRRISKRFPECVKVMVEKTKDILGEGWYNLHRTKKDSTFAHSFK